MNNAVYRYTLHGNFIVMASIAFLKSIPWKHHDWSSVKQEKTGRKF